jgi:Cu/Ag efflux protein CusF
MKPIATLFAVLAIAAFGGGALANDDHHPAAVSQDALSQGVVRKVDKDAGKVTIKHGPLANLDMPAMTMVFRVRDPKMLDVLKPGDASRFRAEDVDGNLTVTQVRRAD